MRRGNMIRITGKESPKQAQLTVRNLDVMAMPVQISKEKTLAKLRTFVFSNKGGKKSYLMPHRE